jgi:RNA polymerase sigma-70 factor (ECF subfamily)
MRDGNHAEENDEHVTGLAEIEVLNNEAMVDDRFDMNECLASVRAGDEDAARQLMQRLYPQVISIIRTHRPRRTAEEDLTQMVFIKIFTKLGQFSGNVPFEHWVSRIAVNTCLNQLKAEKIRPEVRWADLSEEEEQVLHALHEAGDELPVSESLASRELVDKLLATLKPSDRWLITWLHLEGCTMEEIREKTGWNIALIKIRAFRARRKLKKQLVTLLKESAL